MKLVAAAFGNNANLSARAASELRRGHAGLHRELLDRVCKAEVTQRRVDLRIDDADAVEQKHVGLRARPGDIEAAPPVCPSPRVGRPGSAEPSPDTGARLAAC